MEAINNPIPITGENIIRIHDKIGKLANSLMKELDRTILIDVSSKK